VPTTLDARAALHRSVLAGQLSRTPAHMDQRDVAVHHLRIALGIFQDVGDHVGEARTHLALSNEMERQGKGREALRHAMEA
jgi:hypothetical protein